MSKYEIWNLVFQGVLAAGALILAVLALFGENIRRWLFRPKISVEVGTAGPFVELFEEQKESTSKSRTESQEIRIRLSNTGKTTARNCKVLVDEIYEERRGSGDLYKSRSFVPKELIWTTGGTSWDLLPNIPSYVMGARIAEQIEQSDRNSQDRSPTPPKYSLFVRIEEGGQKGKYLEIGKGTVAFPIVVFAENVATPFKRYVLIFWNGETPTDISPSRFSVKLLSKEEFARKIGGVS